MTRSTFVITLAVVLTSIVLAGCGEGPPSRWGRAGYHVRGKTVWFLANWTSTPFVVTGADPATFQFPLAGSDASDTGYARDAGHVYLRGLVITGADPATFEMVDPRFARDARQVYLGDQVFCDDPAHFSRVSANFVKNSHSVFLINDRAQAEVVSKDVAGFREISHNDHYSYCLDSTQVFVNGALLPGAEAGSFQVLGGAYARDATQTFYFNKPMPAGTDMATLQPLAGGYGKDKNRAYYLGRVLEGADAATFEITDPSWPRARDKDRDYEQGNIKVREAVAK